MHAVVVYALIIYVRVFLQKPSRVLNAFFSLYMLCHCCFLFLFFHGRQTNFGLPECPEAKGDMRGCATGVESIPQVCLVLQKSFMDSAFSSSTVDVFGKVFFSKMERTF